MVLISWSNWLELKNLDQTLDLVKTQSESENIAFGGVIVLLAVFVVTAIFWIVCIGRNKRSF